MSVFKPLLQKIDVSVTHITSFWDIKNIKFEKLEETSEKKNIIRIRIICEGNF